MLFRELLQMKQDGVFLSQSEIDIFKAAKVNLTDKTRGMHPPGGYFAWPPGSEWLEKVDWLKDEGGSLSDQCFDIPKDLSGTGVVCGFELILFVTAAARGGEEFADLACRFWLAKICCESPGACGFDQ